ncbi:MAG TPA: peptidylprolyl isomerase [Candidatus Cloacimonadota bacterium]|nr:peptidylprolyl isomerase [Candidatus Cloacimonadota bacterium]
MQIIAKVYDLDIYESEIRQECRNANPCMEDSPDVSSLNSALAHLVDRMLLLHKAEEIGLKITDDEYDAALMDILDVHESDIIPTDASKRGNFEAGKLEKLIKSKILIKKYLASVTSQPIDITEEELRDFYDEQREVFFTHEEVRASHILVKDDTPDALARVIKIRSEIKTPRDFETIVCDNTGQPSCLRCGDLGFFPRGKLIKEIEDIAFSLKLNEISQPFQTKHGYHILMLTDRRKSNSIKFEDIKDSLRARLIHIEREFLIIKHITELRKQAQDHIVILDPSYHL